MRITFRGRLACRFTLSFGLLLLAASAAIWLGTSSWARRDLDSQLRTLAVTELASAVDEYRGVHLHDFPAGALAGGEYTDKLTQLLATDGKVLAALPPALRGVRLLSPDEVKAATEGEAEIAERRVLGRPVRLTALRTAKDGVAYVLVVGFFTDRLEAGLRALAGLLAAVWAAGVVLAGGLGFFLAKRALGPVDQITTRAGEIASGDFSARLDPPAADDELGRMTHLLNRMLDRLSEALEANRRFAADASHELRTPLTAMLGELDVAAKRPRTPEEYRETLDVLKERASEMRRLIDDLILLARAHEGRLELQRAEVPLGPLLGDAVARAAPLAAARGITIDASGVEPVVAYADARLLARVVDNLVQNAVRYDRDRGRVSLRAAAEPDHGDPGTPGFVRIEVEDTGPGIDPAEHALVFERFYRADKSRSRQTGGTGLGLPLAREILRHLAGEVTIARSTPQGTTFRIRLPGGSRSGVRGAGVRA